MQKNIIKRLLLLPYWQDDRFKKLLSSSLLANSSKIIRNIAILITLAEKYNIDRYLNTSYLCLKSPSQNYALISYLIDNGYDLIVENKLNSVFSYQPYLLKEKFNIDLNELIKKYPFDEEKVLGSEGVNLK